MSLAFIISIKDVDSWVYEKLKQEPNRSLMIVNLLKEYYGEKKWSAETVMLNLMKTLMVM